MSVSKKLFEEMMRELKQTKTTLTYQLEEKEQKGRKYVIKVAKKNTIIILISFTMYWYNV